MAAVAFLLLAIVQAVTCTTTCRDCQGHDVGIGSGITVSSVTPTGTSDYVTSDFLDPNPTNIFTAPTQGACFVVALAFTRPVTDVDICQVEVATKFITELTFLCGGISEQRVGIPPTSSQTTIFDIKPQGNDDECKPNAAASCTLCIKAPSIEAVLGGFDISACDCCTDCVLGEWSEWGQCDVTCGAGERTRTRPVLVPNNDCGETCDETEQTEPCEIPCCLAKDRYDIDCLENKGDISSVAITPPHLSADDVVYTQDPWDAVRGCDGKLILAKNDFITSGNGYRMDIVETNVYSVCITCQLCKAVQVELSDAGGGVALQAKTRGQACPTCHKRDWVAYCFEFSSLSDFGAQGVTAVDFTFTWGKSKEWIIRDAYITACPPKTHHTH
jgi:hypothetical protein